MPRSRAGGPAGTEPRSKGHGAAVVGGYNPLAVRAGVRADGQRFDVRVDEIAPNPRNVREDWEWEEADFAEFARNLDKVSQLQDCTVAAVEVFLDKYPTHAEDFDSNKRWVLLMGERRYRSALHNGREVISAVLRNDLVAKGDRVFLSENNDRKGFNPIQEGKLYARIHEEEGLSYDAIAAELGKGTKTTISKCVRLFKDLPDGPVRRAVQKGELGRDPAYALLTKLETPELIERAYERMTADGLTAGRAISALLNLGGDGTQVSSAKQGSSDRAPADGSPGDDGSPQPNGQASVPEPRSPAGQRGASPARPVVRQAAEPDEAGQGRIDACRAVLAAREYPTPDTLTRRIAVALLAHAHDRELSLAVELAGLDDAPGVAERTGFIRWVNEADDASLGTRIADATVLAFDEVHHRKTGPRVRDERQRQYLRLLIDEAGYRPTQAEAETMSPVSSTKH